MIMDKELKIKYSMIELAERTKELDELARTHQERQHTHRRKIKRAEFSNSRGGDVLN
jgi:hypothetical protein